MSGTHRWIALMAGTALVVLALLTVRLRAEVVVEGILLGRSGEQTQRFARRLEHAGLVAETRLARLCADLVRPGAVRAVRSLAGPPAPPSPAPGGEVARP